MVRRSSCVVVLASAWAFLQIMGCGGGGSSTKVLSVLTTSLPNGTVGTNYSATLSATGGAAPYTWSQSSGGDMPGGVTLGSSGIFTGTPTTPGTFGPYVFTVKDSANSTAASTSLSITVTGSALTVTTTSLPNGAVGSAYSVTLTASGGSSPYTWTETSGGALPAGLAAVTSAGVIAGTPTAPGTYGPYVFTVTDSTNATAASVNLSLTVTGAATAVCTPQGNESALTSANPYAFLLKGTDSKGNPIDIAGSFTPNGAGAITAAAADYNGFTTGPQALQVDLAASSYSYGPSGQGCLYLSFSGLAPAAATSQSAFRKSTFKPAISGQARKVSIAAATGTLVANVQFSFALGGFDGTVYHAGRIIESDNTNGAGTNAAGLIHVQSPATFALAALQPNYAFGVDGWTVTAPGILRTAMAGTFTNTGGTLSNGFADLVTSSGASGELTGGHGILNTAIDTTTGRGTGSYFVTTNFGNLTFDFAYYVLNGSDLLLLSTDLSTGTSTNPLLAGRALASNPAVGTLNGYYLLTSQGLVSSGAAAGNAAEIGIINATSAGSVPGATIYSNLAGTYASNQYPGSSYTVEAASGRVSFAGLTTAPPIVYLTAGAASDDAIVGFLVGTDTTANSGVLVSQTGAVPTYSVASVTGNYPGSTAEDVDGSNGAFLGIFAFDGTGNYTAASPLTTGSISNVPHAGTISINTDGSGSLDSGNFPLVTNGSVVFAIPNSGDPLLYIFTAPTQTP